ncbi:hypothetical protein D9757_009855 [Collybiopsis confluens]|uniref:Uncharacterized protein n=1 Tax=Collybiopsis confluens TaxID=2823264 RepID=A0A8H5M232_9AGAR|nr:hypothetical protein D9757_009855 [Collybiopsis confluens]
MSTLTVTIASLPVIAAFDSTLSFSVLSSQLRGSFQFAQTSPTVQATVTVSAPSFASTTVMTLFFHPCPDGVQAVLGNDFAQCCYRALLPSLPSQLPQAPVGFSASLTPPLLPAVVAFPGYHVDPGYIPPGPTYWPVPFPMAGSLGVISSAQSFIQGHTLAPALEHSQSFDTPAPTSRGISWQADSPSNQMQGAGDRGTSITAGTSVSAASTPHKAPTTRELIEATLFANGGTGVHCSAFSSDHGRLVRFCHNHGMDVKGLHSISQCRNALLHHILNGHCFISWGDHSAPACHHFSVNCNSRVSLIHTISEALCTAGSVALPTSKLIYILDAIGHREVFDVRSHRREIKRVIKQYFTKLSSQLSNAKRSPLPDAIEDIFQNFERLSFPSLTQYCRSHRILFNLATDRAETLRELIAIHIVSGECYSMEPERDRARGCRAVTELFDFSTNANSPTDSEATLNENFEILFAFESGGNLLEAFCELDKCSLAADWFFDAGYAFKNATKQLPEFELDFLRVLEEVAEGGRMPFALTPRSDRAYDADKAAQVWVFERGLCTVELVATYKTPFDLVLDFNSTSAMNALTHLHAYCLYPSLTFKSDKALVLNMTRDMAPALRSEQDQNFFDELKGQGFKVVSSPLEWEACNPCCALTFLKPRFLSDRHTLQVDVSVIDKSLHHSQQLVY